ncbi:MAG: flavin reductase family protein [Marinobacter sp.]|uniref:flavin reductase family protein n=1 Tax=Marinobacter sp. TaxID=50741 RepID=UPI00299D9CDE|nr:flavin reductase family protein [Marinobacter sp.]MDX1635284.1 flavin reductase family protein [Marinobacter sp.]
MIIDFDELSAGEIYHAMTQTIIPRPVAWILSENPNGDYNLAPFSFFTAIGSAPPLIMVSVGKKPTGEFKDTRTNIEARGRFTIHLAHRELAADMTETSRVLPHGESELNNVDLELVDFDGFSMPRLADCRIALGCELYEIKEVGDQPQSLIFGRIRRIFVADDVTGVDDKGRFRVNAERVDPIGRLGGSEYVTFGEVLTIPRPT